MVNIVKERSLTLRNCVRNYRRRCSECVKKTYCTQIWFYVSAVLKRIKPIGREFGGKMELEALPEGCIANILSLATPVDACRLSLVSKVFRSAAESDSVWERFIPSDYSDLIALSPSLADAPSRKALFLALCDRPIIIDQGKKSFQLDRKSGKKCYMLAARALTIVWGDTEQYWNWTAMPESRFPEVAKLLAVCWLEIRGMINTIALSPNTRYAAYLVFNMTHSGGFHYWPVELSVGTICGHSSSKNVCLDPKIPNGKDRRHKKVVGLQRPSVRSDGWLEIEMGEFFNSGLEDEVQMSVIEIKGGLWKSGLLLEGIEVRPKEGN